jgi:filamentous hemagglutinin family protein
MLHRKVKSRGHDRSGLGRGTGLVGAGRLITAGVLAGVTSVPALAGPQGEQVVHGSASFTRQGAHTTIKTSQQAIINYQSFNLTRGESVRFVQPGASSKVLNRIQSAMPSMLDGAIFANGSVYFVNPAGIYFGPNSVINVGAIYAAAGNMSNADFLNGINRFTDLRGEVINHGLIHAPRGAHLVGRRVANFGTIASPDGLVTMSAGEDVLIGSQGGRVYARISGDAGAGGAGLENHGVIDAGSGRVLAGVGDHFALALFDSSSIRAGSVSVAGGRNSTVRVGGTIDASSRTGRGGEIEVLGGKIGLQGATLDASGATGGGSIHVGGDFQGRGERLRSELTYVDADSSIRVDATRRGDGGRAIVWSDGATVFHGDVSAKGAVKGGFAEVSGKEYLEFRGGFDLRGALGNGTLLLDPKNIDILPNGTAGSSIDPNDFSTFAVDPSLTSTIDADVLSTWLDGGFGAQIILQASNDIRFLAGATVTQTVGNVDLVLDAGRNILFLTGSSLSLLNGSLIATANNTGFVPGERDPGQGIFAVLNGASVTSAGGSLVVTMMQEDTGGSNPGPIAMLGGFNAPTITLTSLHPSKGVVAMVGDQDVVNLAFGADLTINAGLTAAFLTNGGADWSFNSLDVTSAVILFDSTATGVSGPGGLSFTSGAGQTGLVTQAAGAFTFTGATTLNSNYDASGAAVFAGTLDLGANIRADGDITFQQDVTLTGALAAITLDDPDTSGDLVDFRAAVLGTAANGLTLNLNGGSATFAGQVGTNASEIGDLIVNGLGGTLDFQQAVFANSLTSLSGAGDIILGGDLDLRGVGADAVNSLNLLASNATIEIHGDIVAFADINIGSAAELHGGGTNTITLTNGGLLTFGDTLNANAGENLTVNLNGGSATFAGQVGTNAAALGDLVVNTLGGTLEFQQAVFANSLTSLSGAGNIVLGGDLDLRGVSADAVNSLNLLADNALAIEIHGDIVAFADINIGSAAELHGGGTNTITLANGGLLTFGGTLNANAGENLTVDLNGGGATFAGQIGTNAAALGEIVINGLGGTLDFQSDVFADALGSGSGAGRIILGGDLDLRGVLGAQPFSLNLLATNAQSIEVHGDITAAGSVLFATRTEFFGGGTRTITLVNGGDLQFSNIVFANAGENLTVNLNGGGASFAVDVGVAGAFGDLVFVGLGTTLSFDGSVLADSLTSTSGAGTINLGDGFGVDTFTFQGDNGAGNAVELIASNATINLRGDITAQQANAAVVVGSRLEVFGDRTITTNIGLIDLASVTLNTAGGDSILRLLSTGGGISVAAGAGETVRRTADGLNQASLFAVSGGGNITAGPIGDTLALSVIDLNAGAGTISYTGARYFGEQILLTGTQHLLPNADVVFGDQNGVSSVVDLITIAGGNLLAVGGRTVELNALDTGGDVNLFGARALGAGSVLTLRADDLVTLGTGDTVGALAQRLGRVNIVSGDVAIQNAIFADGLFLDPLSDILNFGGGAGGMVVDAGEVAILNGGSLGTLFLGHDDRATFDTYLGTTNLFGVPIIGNIEAYGTTTVSGVFNATTGRIELFGPTVFNAGAGLLASAVNQGIFFFDSLGVNGNNTITTNRGAVSFVNFIPGPGSQTAAINAGGAGAGLTITTGGGRVTLHDVGDLAALASLTVNASSLVPADLQQVFFQGSTYNAGAQTYTGDEYRILGDIAAPAVANFTGASVLFNDIAGGLRSQIRVASGVDVNFNLTDAFTSNATLIRNAAANNQDIAINATNQVIFNGTIGIDNLGNSFEIGSVTLAGGLIRVNDVLTQGGQTYTGGLIDLRGTRYQSLTGSTIAFNGPVVLNPAVPGMIAVTTANGGTVFFNGASVNGNDNTLVVNTGANGQVRYRAGIDINNAGQQYTAGAYNFLGSATLSSDQPNAGIVFNGGTLNLGGTLGVQTVGPNGDIALGGLVNLNGFNLDAFATGLGGDVTLPALVSNGGEIVRVRANGGANLAGIQNVGVGTLDLRSNTLAINGATLADNVLIRAFDPARGISVGQNIAGTLNLSNNTLGNLAPVAGGQNTLLVGETGYNGPITIDNATMNRNTRFIADGANGVVRVQGGGLTGTGAFGDLDLIASDVQLGAPIGSNAGAFSLDITGPANIFGNAAIGTNGGALTFGGPINGLLAGAGFLDVNTAGGAINLPAGAIGQTRALGQLRLVGAPTLTLGGARTSGDQFFNSGNILLLGGSAFNAMNGASIVFSGLATALGNLQVQVAGAGAANRIQFVNPLLGNNTAGQALSFDAGTNGTIAMNGIGAPGSAAGSVNAVGGEITTGDILALGAVNANAAQNLGAGAIRSGGGITLNAGGNLGVGAMIAGGDILAGGGQIVLGGDIQTPANLTLNGARMFLPGDRVLTAANIALNGDLDSQGAPAALRLENAATTLLNGRFGGNSPLASFTSSGNGTTTLAGGGVFTSGRALFRNDVLVQGPATVQSLGTGAADGIRFLGTIDGTAPNTGDLTLIVDRSKGELIVDPVTGRPFPDADVPVIELFGSVGLTNALSSLAFNVGFDLTGAAVDGRAFVPANATIILGDRDAFEANGTLTNFTLNADRLLMGAREKLLALGGLRAGGSFARIGDMAAVTDLIVAFNQVEVLLREAGLIFDPTTLLSIDDVATDFVANGRLEIGTITQLTLLTPGASNPEFAVPGGNAFVQSNAGQFLFKSLGEDVANLILSGGVFLDPRADGPSNTNVAEAIAGASPRQQDAEPVVTDVELSQEALEALNDLSIVIKTPDDEGYLLDMPRVGEPIIAQVGEARVSRRRLEPELVVNLVDRYNTAFKESVVDENGEVRIENRRDRIVGTLGDAASEFESSNGGDLTATGLLAFLEQNPGEQAPALGEIDRLRQIVTGARMLGLTEREVLSVKSRLIALARPDQIPPSVFAELIEPGQTVLLGVR